MFLAARCTKPFSISSVLTLANGPKVIALSILQLAPSLKQTQIKIIREIAAGAVPDLQARSGAPRIRLRSRAATSDPLVRARAGRARAVALAAQTTGAGGYGGWPLVLLGQTAHYRCSRFRQTHSRPCRRRSTSVASPGA
jgi:hypothetical protein